MRDQGSIATGEQRCSQLAASLHRLVPQGIDASVHSPELAGGRPMRGRSARHFLLTQLGQGDDPALFRCQRAQRMVSAPTSPSAVPL